MEVKDFHLNGAKTVHGGALFIALDSNLFIDEGKYRKPHAIEPFASYRAEQLRWVRDVLERYRPDPSIRAIFVAFHHSPFVTYEAPGGTFTYRIVSVRVFEG